MATITIDNLQSKSIHCEDKRERLLDVLLTATDWMHACGGKGRCTTCKARILEGMEHLSERTEAEERYMKMDKLRANERLMCQVRTSGDVRLSVPRIYQLPHLKYSK